MTLPALAHASRRLGTPTAPRERVRRAVILALPALLALCDPLAQARAQEPSASAAAARAEAGEPRASTSAQDEAGEPRAETSTPMPADAPARPSEHAAAAPAPGAARASVKGARGAEPKGSKPGAVDRLDLNTATVTGDREQPKVMYIVPWKKSDIGDLSGKPMNSLLDEALAPVDRDEFKREVIYYNVVKSDATQNGAPTPAAKGEK